MKISPFLQMSFQHTSNEALILTPSQFGNIRYLRISYHIVQKELDHGCDWFYVEPINQQSGDRDKEIKMTKQNKNSKEKATLEEMVKSGSQLVLMREDGSEQPIEDIVKKDGVLKLGTTMKVIEMDKTGLDSVESDPIENDPLADWFYYDSWWNQFRAPGCSRRR
jgi:hypothetical protein